MFVRFGAKGPGAIGLGTAVVVVLALLLLLGPIIAIVSALRT